jgi:hypothetical protein
MEFTLDECGVKPTRAERMLRSVWKMWPLESPEKTRRLVGMHVTLVRAILPPLKSVRRYLFVT